MQCGECGKCGTHRDLYVVSQSNSSLYFVFYLIVLYFIVSGGHLSATKWHERPDKIQAAVTSQEKINSQSVPLVGECSEWGSHSSSSSPLSPESRYTYVTHVSHPCRQTLSLMSNTWKIPVSRGVTLMSHTCHTPVGRHFHSCQTHGKSL
jgi:hypothetical protein